MPGSEALLLNLVNHHGVKRKVVDSSRICLSFLPRAGLHIRQNCKACLQRTGRDVQRSQPRILVYRLNASEWTGITAAAPMLSIDLVASCSVRQL
mmetsp:Transcript_29218/g.80208  ORF Transcript_29218/g.80208 Transcript_29218/m.80208 type:complete len:95 (+) Transcript_29218:65-349(+)